MVSVAKSKLHIDGINVVLVVVIVVALIALLM